MLLGSVSSMITTLRNNSRKKDKTHFNYTGVTGNLNKLTEKKMPPDKFIQFKVKLKKEKRRSIILYLIIFGISALLTVLFFIFIVKI